MNEKTFINTTVCETMSPFNKFNEKCGFAKKECIILWEIQEK